MHPGAVVFTGAGMSTESGLPDFRSQRRPLEAEPPLRGAGSVEALETDYDEHVAFYRWRIEMLAAHAPNDGHRVVADWQRRGLIGTIVTQNVDGFHTRAGAAGVLELHGTLANVRCDRCGVERPAVEFLGARRSGLRLRRQAQAGRRAVRRGAARGDAARGLGGGRTAHDCSSCSGRRWPSRPPTCCPRRRSDAGAPLVIVNHDPTPLDRMATLVINASIGETLQAVDRLLAP